MYRLHYHVTRLRSNHLVLMEFQEISALRQVGRMPLVARDTLGNVLFVTFHEDFLSTGGSRATRGPR